MKILIVSDLHGNAEAIAALPSDYDRLWVLGDLVNYGPNPKESIEFVRENADLIVRGNHDHAIGFATDPRCSGPYREMAAEMGRLTQALISEEDRSFLRTLPLSVTTEIRGQRFHLCHAAPSDPLFAYRPPESEEWEQEVQGVAPGYLLVGHTHLQFRREIGNRTIVNPGSVGQPKSQAPRIAFAVWDDGKLALHTSIYDVEATVRKIGKLDISSKVTESLIQVLRTGSLSDGSVAEAG